MLCTEKPNKLVYYNPKSNEAELTARRWSQCPMNMKHITFVVDTLYLEGYSGYLNMVLSELAPYYRTRIKKISFVVIRSALLSKHTMKNYYIGTILRPLLADLGIADANISTTWTYHYEGARITGTRIITHIPGSQRSTWLTPNNVNPKGEFLNLAQIVQETIVDGPGVRAGVYVQGCVHACEGCHNPRTHEFISRIPYDIDHLAELICENPLLTGVTFSGGEPMLQAHGLWKLAKRIKELKPYLNIIIYTGFTLEVLQKMCKNKSLFKYTENLLEVCDYIVDGKFELDKRSLECPYRGSTNQRFLDIRGENLWGTPVEIDPTTIK